MEASKHCARSSRALIKTFNTSTAHSTTLPSFLVPAFARTSSQQISSFHSSAPVQSKIGRLPLSPPPEVQFRVIETAPSKGNVRSLVGSTVEIEGPLGKMSMSIPPYLQVRENEDQKGVYEVSILDAENKKQRAMWGTVRAYLNNHILGVSEGHAAILRLVGVGYRAMIEDKAVTKEPEYPGQKFVSLKVGYSHPIELGVPMGVKASTPLPTRILLEGVEKEVVKQFAAKIRAWRKPEPYKGKGIFVNDETIKLKAKKIK